MVETRRNWIKWIALVTPCLCVSTVVCAQPNSASPRPLHAIQVQSPQTGSLSGRLTDLHSAPLEGMQVVLRNQATGAAVQAKTGKNGAFRFASLDAGEYTLEAEKSELGHGLLQGIVVTGGTEARMQAAMHFEPPAPALLEADSPNQNGVAARASPMPLLSRAPPAPARAAAPIMASSSPSTAPPISAPLVSAPLTATIVPPRTPLPAAPQPASHAPAPPRRAELETQSAAIEPTLAIALPRAFPLKAGFAPDLSASTAVAEGAQMLMRLKLPHPAPIFAAVERGDERADPVTPAVASTVTATQLQALPVEWPPLAGIPARHARRQRFCGLISNVLPRLPGVRRDHNRRRQHAPGLRRRRRLGFRTHLAGIRSIQ